MSAGNSGSIYNFIHNKKFRNVLALILIVLAAAEILLPILIAVKHKENNVYQFQEKAVQLQDGWTLTDTAGKSREISLPCTIEYGTDGIYVLSRVMEADDEFVGAQTLAFHSNYMDVSVSLDGELLYSFPAKRSAMFKATGNTWHMVSLPRFEGRLVEIGIKCQLGDAITYSIKAPKIGAKATIFNEAVSSSIAPLIIVCIMMLLAITMTVVYLASRKKLGLDDSLPYLAGFSLVFAIYIYLESPLARFIGPNGYVVYTCTFLLLALLPLPVVGFFHNQVEDRLRPSLNVMIGVCLLNFLLQSVLHYTGVYDLRLMVPMTHMIIALCCAAVIASVLLTDRRIKPHARTRLLAASPMIVGAIADIGLLCTGMPSMNNCFWFMCGVTLFILIQFMAFARAYFRVYHLKIENETLRSMAYTDALTGLSNRNAYELHLKDLSGKNDCVGLGCIVADINKLKQINDTFGHGKGDRAICAASSILQDITPDNGCCYRTGGDEFVILIEGADEKAIGELLEKTVALAQERGSELKMPISIAASGGCYSPEDGSIKDFIRRIDTQMYFVKRKMDEED